MCVNKKLLPLYFSHAFAIQTTLQDTAFKVHVQNEEQKVHGGRPNKTYFSLHRLYCRILILTQGIYFGSIAFLDKIIIGIT